MSDRIEWHGDEATAHVRQLAVGFLTRAAITVERRARELLSVPGTVQSVGGSGKRHGKRHGKKKARATGVVRSKPGEPPRKQFGTLRASVTHEIDEANLAARVGTPMKVGRWLELGTKRGLAPRPWLRRALAEMQSQVNQLLSQIGKP